MVVSLEEKLGIIPVEEAINEFNAVFSDTDLTKLQIEPEGPYIKYEMVGNDGEYKNTLEINAHTKTVLKEKQKPLKEKYKDPVRRERKTLNLENLMPLIEINDIAQLQVGVGEAYQWELDRSGTRTIWKIEFADTTGDNVTEVKIGAHDGAVVQMKIKN